MAWKSIGRDLYFLIDYYRLLVYYANRLINICIEIYKIKNGLNPEYMNDLITEKLPQHHYRKPLDLLNPKPNQISFGYKSFQTLEPTIWNTLPAELQALNKLDDFKTKIGNLDFAWCSCQKCCDIQKQAQHNP